MASRVTSLNLIKKTEKKELVLSIMVNQEQWEFVNEMAKGFEGNKSMVVRSLIEREMERRLGE